MKTIQHHTDLCVVGGGMAGLCAAIAAARNGIRVVLVHDRPVLGGNASSEIRMWICGAHGEDNRETGILEELVLANYYSNPGLKYSLWDSVLYEKVRTCRGMTLLLNTACFDARSKNGRIQKVIAWQSNAETFHEITATVFADCSGDSVLAPLTGAEFRIGREGKTEFNESIAPDKADNKTMGMSCLFQVRETPRKTEFIPPTWAYRYPDEDALKHKNHTLTSNFWWIETSGEGDPIYDTDACRDELLKIVYGVWDHIKNYGDHGADNWELEWIGFLPGKRESRRYVGDHILTQHDVESGGHFNDVVAYGGWSMDDHFPAGFYHTDGPSTIHHPAPSPWGIPLRSLCSKNIENLVFAGRNISATHTAMSSSRVMGTCAMVGQAVGTAAALAVKSGVGVRAVDIRKVQKQLLDDDCCLPGRIREVGALARGAGCTAETVRDGIDRGTAHCWLGAPGDTVTYTFAEETPLKAIRLVFDSNLNRGYQNMPCCYPLEEPRFKIPPTLMREYKLILTAADGQELVLHEKENCRRFVCHSVDFAAVSVKLVPLASWGDKTFRVFGFEPE